MSRYKRVRFSFGSRGGIPPATRTIIIISIFIYGLQSMAGIFLRPIHGFDLVTWFLGLNPELIRRGFVFQLATYMFLHGGIFHILFNMFVLWMFGSEIERKWGTKRFVKYYLFTGTFAGVCSFLLAPAMTVGASGAIYGLLLAFAMIDPNRIIYFYFVIPMKAWVFVIIIGAIELFSSISGTRSGIAHLAHLGGIVGGVIYILIDRRRRRRKFYQDKVVDLEQYMKRRETSRSVDEILDKVIKSGMESLTPEEKKKLIDAGHYFKHFDDKV